MELSQTAQIEPIGTIQSMMPEWVYERGIGLVDSRQ